MDDTLLREQLRQSEKRNEELRSELASMRASQAQILAMKFAFHMPTYREQDWFAQCGWFPSRSTVNDLINYGVDTIGPLHNQMWLLLLEQPILLGDDTTLRVLLRGALSEEDLAKLGKRSRFRQALDSGQPPNTGPPGSATSYAWLGTGLTRRSGHCRRARLAKRSATFGTHGRRCGYT